MGTFISAMFSLTELTAPEAARVYAGPELANIAMPVGGICAGQVYFKGDGRLSHWDIMNGRAFGATTLVRPAANLQQGLAVRVRDASGQLMSFPLTLETFPATTFTAEYPAGVVRHAGAKNLPLDLTLEGIAPFVPLDAAASGIPATFLRVTVKNTSTQVIEGDVLGWLENGASHLSGLRAEEGSRTATVRRVPGALAVEFAAQPSAAALVANAEQPLPPRLMANWGTTDFMRVSAAGDDTILESAAFVLDRNCLRFVRAREQDATRVRIELRRGDEVLFAAPAAPGDVRAPVLWDLRAHLGETARLVAINASPSAGVVFDHVELFDQALAPLTARPDFGTMALVLLAPDVDAGAWPSISGELAAGAAPVAAATTRPFDERQIGALAAPFRLSAGETRRFTFAIGWHFPNFELSDWNKPQGRGRWYATRYASASAVVDELAARGLELVAAIDLWRETYYDATVPRWLLDRAIANLSTLATGTCHRFADGRFYGFEGVYSFPGTCNHVWHYEEGMGRLFPELEKSLRELADYAPAVGIKSDGSIAMRIDGAPGAPDPLPEQPILFGPGYEHWASIDGQCGILLRTYRTHLLETDVTFVRAHWPQIRRATEWLLAQDSDGDGLPDLVTHHTLDEDIAGPSPWISSLNLAALTAVAKLARLVGDTSFASLCEDRVALGQANFIAKLWTGERFVHLSPEAEKWRPGSYDGSHIDQVLGQQWAWRTGLGRILPEKETRAALASVFRHNFMADLGPYYAEPVNKPSRPFAQAGMAGTVMATWPAGAYRPDGLRPDHVWDRGNHCHQGFYNETMSGFEHAFAAHLVYEGMVTEGLTVARAVHERHQPSSPKRANPFNEPEAGQHYARAMASYATLLAYGGFEYDGPAGVIGFAPRAGADAFRTPFTAAEGWGSFRQEQRGETLTATLTVKRGTLKLTTVKLAVAAPANARAAGRVSVTHAGRPLGARHEVFAGTMHLTLAEPLVLSAGHELTVEFTR